jgi:precorrin-8X/cobalt-precorrin-8 methylmutase
MIPQHHLPADIERTSMQIIAKELEERHIRIPRENLAVVKRVIHTTADFEYAETLHFTENAVQKAIEALHNGATIITDTNMALAGISKPGLKKLNGEALCFMADPTVAQSAKESGTTRAVAAMHKAAKEYPGAILAATRPPRCSPLPRRSKTVCAPRSSSVCRSAL